MRSRAAGGRGNAGHVHGRDQSRGHELQAAIGGSIPTTLDHFRRHPLARWVEAEFGVEPEADGRLQRRVPRTLAERPASLAEVTGVTRRPASAATRSAQPGRRIDAERWRAGLRVQAAPVHRSGPGALCHAGASGHDASILDGGPNPGRRGPHLRSDQVLPPVWPGLLPRAAERLGVSGRTRSGWRMPGPQFSPATSCWRPPRTTGATDRIPEEWRDRRAVRRRPGATVFPRRCGSSPTGSLAPRPHDDAIKMWWQARAIFVVPELRRVLYRRESANSASSPPFPARRGAARRPCWPRLSCVTRAGSRRLETSCSRSPITARTRRFRPVISTTSSMSRCFARRLFAALPGSGELTFDTGCPGRGGLVRSERSATSRATPSSTRSRPRRSEVWRAFTEITEYRLYEDLRRGWRVVQPNLEHVGLLRVGYRGLEAVCADQAHWRFDRAVAGLPQRARIARSYRPRSVPPQARDFRRCLQETDQQQLRRRAEQHLNEFWGLDRILNELRAANRFVRPGRSARQVEGFSLSERSASGKYLRQ